MCAKNANSQNPSTAGPIDAPFLFSFSNWTPTTPLTLSTFDWSSLSLDGIYDPPADSSDRQSYLFTNPKTGEMAYATPTTPHELTQRLIQYAEERYQQGYAAGYSSGFASGHNKGYQEGVRASHKPPQQAPRPANPPPNAAPPHEQMAGVGPGPWHEPVAG